MTLAAHFNDKIACMGWLDVVDEQGNVVGKNTRHSIHAKGLLHREIHVWFYTPKGEIIFQHRAKDKDTFPDKLDATVGGHVEIGSDFEDTAVKEVEEETGLKVNKNDLRLVKTVRSNHIDPTTGKINNVIRKVFAYKFACSMSVLRVEEVYSQGFELWPIKEMDSYCYRSIYLLASEKLGRSGGKYSNSLCSKCILL